MYEKLLLQDYWLVDRNEVIDTMELDIYFHDNYGNYIEG